MAALIVGCLTLLFNIAVAFWLSTKRGTTNQLVVLERRSCESSRKLMIAAHFFINILAAVLLALSNYCMQVLSSPVREEVDSAHAANKWVYIGVPNLRNLRHIPWSRRALFLALAVSSLPVHLLWNSAIVQGIPANNYHGAAVSEDFLTGGVFDTTGVLATKPANADVFEREWYKPMLQNPANLTVAECLDEYTRPFISDYSNLAVVMDMQNSPNSLMGAWTYWTVQSALQNVLSPDWPCAISLGEDPFANGLSCDLMELATTNATYWNPFSQIEFQALHSARQNIPDDVPVKHCLAQKTHRDCHIGLTPPIIWIVLAANVIKVLCFWRTLLWVRGSSKPMITVGDAIDSFVTKPDPILSHRCLTSVSEVRLGLEFWKAPETPQRWRPKRRLWLCGASSSSWLSLFLPAVVGLYMHDSLNSCLSLGFSASSIFELVWWDLPSN